MFAKGTCLESNLSKNCWQLEQGVKLLALSNIKAGDTVLDLSCGTGELSLEIAKMVGPFGRVIGVESDKDLCEIAKAAIPESVKNVTIIGTSFENLNVIDDASIDVVFCNYVLHWVSNKYNLLNELHRCLRPGGWIVMEHVGVLMPFLQGVTSLTGEEGSQLLNRFHCMCPEEWESLFERTNFSSDNFDLPTLEYKFDDLEQLFDWWEDVSNNMFDRKRITTIDFVKLTHQYAGELNYHGSAFRSIATKKAN